MADHVLSAADDQLVRGLLRLARAVAERRLAPRRLRVASGAGLALAATVRVVARVHRRASYGRPDPQPAAAAGLAARLVLVLDITDLAHRGLTANVDPSQLARRHADDRVVALFREQLGRRASGSGELPATPERQLDVVHSRADRDPGEGKRVADSHWRLFPALDGVADLQAERREDIALLAVLVVDKRDARAAVRIVLDGRDLAFDAVLVALEVDLPVQLPVAAALMTRGDATLVVAACMRGQRLDQRLLRLVGRDLLEAGDRHEAAAGAGGLELSYRHGGFSIRSRRDLRFSGLRRA